MPDRKHRDPHGDPHRVKRPAIQFYPGDWLRDTALRSCSIAARGLWMDMLCLMHEGEPYGHLRVGAKILDAAALARMVGESPAKVRGWLAELRDAGVSSTLADGTIYSRRMVKDEHIRQVRAASGKLGGNPALVGHHTERGSDAPREDKQNPARYEDKQTNDVGGDLDKQPSKQSPTPAVATATASASASARDPEQVVVAAREIVAALNRGLAEHDDPHRRQLEPIRPTAPGSRSATRELLDAGVPVSFAVTTVGALARSHTAEGKVYSLGYFAPAITRAWQLETARRDAEAAPPPGATPPRGRTPLPFPPRRPTIGERMALENEARRRRGEAPPDVLFVEDEPDTTDTHEVTADAQS